MNTQWVLEHPQKFGSWTGIPERGRLGSEFFGTREAIGVFFDGLDGLDC